MNEEIIERVKKFEKVCLAVATNLEGGDYQGYEKLRSEIFEISYLNPVIPEWLRECRYGSVFRSKMQSLSSSYKGRRDYISNQFNPIYSFCENFNEELDAFMNAKLVIESLNNQLILGYWNKVKQRYQGDYDGTITAAKSLVESTLYYILDELSVEYGKNETLPKLYNLVSKQLNLAPTDETHNSIKKILSGLVTSIQGLSEYRNLVSDSHGSNTVVKIEKYHVNLIVNLCGMFVEFLISVYKK